MHRTVLIVLLSFGVAGTGFLTTTVSSLQQHLTSDIPLTNQLQSFQLIPQFCGEAIALIVWYFVYRRRDDRPLPPSATAPPPNAAFDNSFRPIPLSASTIVDGRPVLTSPDSSAEPLLTPNSAGAAVDSKSAAPPVAGTAPAQPLRVRTYKGTGTGVGLAWYELVFWAFVFAAMDGIATIAWGRDWIPNPSQCSTHAHLPVASHART